MVSRNAEERSRRIAEFKDRVAILRATSKVYNLRSDVSVTTLDSSTTNGSSVRPPASPIASRTSQSTHNVFLEKRSPREESRSVAGQEGNTRKNPFADDDSSYKRASPARDGFAMGLHEEHVANPFDDGDDESDEDSFARLANAFRKKKPVENKPGISDTSTVDSATSGRFSSSNASSSIDGGLFSDLKTLKDKGTKLEHFESSAKEVEEDLRKSKSSGEASKNSSKRSTSSSSSGSDGFSIESIKSDPSESNEKLLNAKKVLEENASKKSCVSGTKDTQKPNPFVYDDEFKMEIKKIASKPAKKTDCASVGSVNLKSSSDDTSLASGSLKNGASPNSVKFEFSFQKKSNIEPELQANEKLNPFNEDEESKEEQFKRPIKASSKRSIGSSNAESSDSTTTGQFSDSNASTSVDGALFNELKGVLQHPKTTSLSETNNPDQTKDDASIGSLNFNASDETSLASGSVSGAHSYNVQVVFPKKRSTLRRQQLNPFFEEDDGKNESEARSDTSGSVALHSNASASIDGALFNDLKGVLNGNNDTIQEEDSDSRSTQHVGSINLKSSSEETSQASRSKGSRKSRNSKNSKKCPIAVNALAMSPKPINEDDASAARKPDPAESKAQQVKESIAFSEDKDVVANEGGCTAVIARHGKKSNPFEDDDSYLSGSFSGQGARNSEPYSSVKGNSSTKETKSLAAKANYKPENGSTPLNGGEETQKPRSNNKVKWHRSVDDAADDNYSGSNASSLMNKGAYGGVKKLLHTNNSAQGSQSNGGNKTDSSILSSLDGFSIDSVQYEPVESEAENEAQYTSPVVIKYSEANPFDSDEESSVEGQALSEQLHSSNDVAEDSGPNCSSSDHNIEQEKKSNPFDSNEESSFDESNNSNKLKWHHVDNIAEDASTKLSGRVSSDSSVLDGALFRRMDREKPISTEGTSTDTMENRVEPASVGLDAEVIAKYDEGDEVVDQEDEDEEGAKGRYIVTEESCGVSSLKDTENYEEEFEFKDDAFDNEEDDEVMSVPKSPAPLMRHSEVDSRLSNENNRAVSNPTGMGSSQGAKESTSRSSKQKSRRIGTKEKSYEKCIDQLSSKSSKKVQKHHVEQPIKEARTDMSIASRPSNSLDRSNPKAAANEKEELVVPPQEQSVTWDGSISTKDSILGRTIRVANADLVAERIYLESLRAQVHAELKVHVADEEIRLALDARLKAIRDFYKRKATTAQLRTTYDDDFLEKVVSLRAKETEDQQGAKPKTPEITPAKEGKKSKVVKQIPPEAGETNAAGSVPPTSKDHPKKSKPEQGQLATEVQEPVITQALLPSLPSIDKNDSQISKNDRSLTADQTVENEHISDHDSSSSIRNTHKFALERAQDKIDEAIKAANITTLPLVSSREEHSDKKHEVEENMEENIYGEDEAEMNIPTQIYTNDTFWDEDRVSFCPTVKTLTQQHYDTVRNAWVFYRNICDLIFDSRVYDYEFQLIQEDPLYPYLNSLVGISDGGEDGYSNEHKRISQIAKREYSDKSPHRICHWLARDAQKALPKLKSICADIGRKLGMQTVAVGPIKTSSAALLKCERKYGGNPLLVTDFCRASLFVSDIATLLALVEIVLSKYSKIVRRIKLSSLKCDHSPLLGGYRDCKINIEIDDHICEIQVHLEPLWNIKEELGYHHYRNCTEYCVDNSSFDLKRTLNGLDREFLSDMIKVGEDSTKSIAVHSLQYYNEDHIRDYSALASLYLHYGLPVRAEYTLRKIVKVRSESATFGPGHTETLLYMKMLLKSLKRQHKYKSAFEVKKKITQAECGQKRNGPGLLELCKQDQCGAVDYAVDMIIDPSKKDRDLEKQKKSRVEQSRALWLKRRRTFFN